MSLKSDLPTVLVPTADHQYYLWMVVTHWAHMRHYGWPTRYLIYTGQEPSELLHNVMATLGHDGARFTVWNDWRPRGRTRYNPAMKPGLVGQWLTANPDQEEKPLLLCDPDALPLPTLKTALQAGELQPTPDRWFGTDTDSYTGPNYLKSKGEDLWVALCDLVGVDPDKAAQARGRGSQWLFTGLPGSTWVEIAELSEDAHRILEAHNSDVQTWCAEMYVTQLVLAREGITAESAPAMRMVWANGPADDWNHAGFFHDAGIVKPDTGHFFKGRFRDKAPFFVDHDDVDPGSASAEYVHRIRAAETLWPHLCAMFP